MADIKTIYIPVGVKADKKSVETAKKEITSSLPRQIEAKIAAKLDTKSIVNFAKESSKQLKELNNTIAFVSRGSRGAFKQVVGKLEASYKDLEKSIENEEKAKEDLRKARKTGDQSQIRIARQNLRTAREDTRLKVKEHQFNRVRVRKELTQHRRTIKARSDIEKGLSAIKKYEGAPAVKKSFEAISKGGLRGGGAQALSGLAESATKSVFSSIAKRVDMTKAMAGEGMGGMFARGAGRLMAGVPGPAMAAGMAGVGAFIKLLVDSSDRVAELNKALTDGLALSNDMMSGATNYMAAMDQFNKEAMNHASMLTKYGKNADDYVKIVNAFAKSTTGSVVKTGAAFATMEGGSEKFVEHALAYGSALGMEATAVADMMGGFVSEFGMGVNQVNTAMKGLVDMAATSNITTSKFLSIFNQAASDSSIFNNRMEELTHTIKVLSKFMGSKDIEKFMNAFKSRFEGMGFQERLGHVLVAGTKKVGKLLSDEFRRKANDIGKAMGGKFGSEFVEAIDKGDLEAARLAVSGAAGMGSAAFGGQVHGDALKLIRAKGEQMKGDSLSMASALKSAGMLSSIKIFEMEMATLRQDVSGGISGIAEQVAHSRGYSQEQINAFNTFKNSVLEMKTSLKATGSTGYFDINKALRSIVSTRLGRPATAKDLQTATNEEIETAMATSDRYQKGMKNAADISQEHFRKTAGISDILKNAITVVLDKIFFAVKPLADALKSLVTFFTIGENDAKKREAQARGIRQIVEGSHAWLGGRNPESQFISKKQRESAGRELERMAVEGVAGQERVSKLKKMFDTNQILSWDRDELINIFGKTAVDTMEDEAHPGLGIKTWTGQSAAEKKKSLDVLLRETQYENLALLLRKAGMKLTKEFGESAEHEMDTTSGNTSYDAMNPEQKAAFDAATGSDLSVPMSLRGSEIERLIEEQIAAGATTVDDLPKALADELRRARQRDNMAASGAVSQKNSGGVDRPVPKPTSSKSEPGDGGGSSPGKSGGSGAQAQAVKVVTAASRTADGVESLTAITTKSNAAIELNTATTAKNISDLYYLINDGIQLDSSFMTNIFKDTMISSIDQGMSKPLLKHALILSRLLNDPELMSGIQYNPQMAFESYSLDSFGRTFFNNASIDWKGLGLYERPGYGTTPSAPVVTTGGVTTPPTGSTTGVGTVNITNNIYEAKDATAVSNALETKILDILKKYNVAIRAP